MKRTAILLAAGCSRRFGTENKLLHLFGSKTMLEAAINALQSTEIFDEIIVVCGYQQEIIANVALANNVSVAYSKKWELGIAESIKAGVLAANDADVILLMPSDMPYLSAATIKAVTHAIDDKHTAAGAKNGDYLGVPAAFLLARYRNELLGLTGDCGAKHILINCVKPITIMADAKELIDIDVLI